jgi:nucleoside-diphosphate-sugar epimerase
MDISLAREWLGYEPQISLVEGLKKTWEWYISHTDEYLNKQNYFRE